MPHLPLFGELPPEVLERLLGALVVRDLARGETIVQEGEPGREAYVVGRGRLRVEKMDHGGALLVAELGPGAIFGEMALVTESYRAASVSAAQCTTVLVAARRALADVAREVPELATELGRFCRDRLVHNLAAFAPCLRALPEPERLELLARCKEHFLERDAVLVRPGDDVRELLLVATGNLEVIAEDGGERTLVGHVGPGDVAGVAAFVLRRPSALRERATGPTTVLGLPLEAFREAARRHPGLLWWLWEVALVRSERLSRMLAEEATEIADLSVG